MNTLRTKSTLAAPGSALFWFAALALLMSAPAALAQDAGHNQLQAVTAQKLDGNRVQLALQLSGPAPEQPLSFTESQPALISLDLADTRLAIKQRKTDVQQGMVNSVLAAEAGGRVRVAVYLSSLVPYSTRVQGNTVYIIVGGGATDTSVASATIFGAPSAAAPAAVVAAAPAPTPVASKAAPVAAPAPSAAPRAAVVGGTDIVNVDFRRGAGGSGEIQVTLPSSGIVGNVHEKGSDIVVDFANAKLPDELVRRMDVTDFATPVQFVDAENTPTGSHLIIHPTGQYEKLAYQSDNVFSMEFKPQTPAAAAAAVSTKKQYTGTKISLTFQQIDVRGVLEILADASGKNIVVSDSVGGNITLRLQDVPWDQALDIILRTKGLATRDMGNILMVGTASEISAQEQAEAQAQASMQQAEPLESAFIQVNYAKASDLAGLVKGSGDSSPLSKRGNLSVDTRTNTLLVQDTPDSINNIRAMVARLDVPVKQVLIESRVVIANNDFTRDLGAQIGTAGSKATSGSFVSETGDLTGVNAMQSSYLTSVNAALTAVNAGTTPVPLVGFTYPSLSDTLNVNTPVAGPSGSIAFGVLKNNFLVNLELAALQSEGQGELVSSPRVVTADQKQAHIEQGVQIPYQQASSSGATSTAFKAAVLSLDATPQITPDGRVNMDLDVHDDSVGQNVPSATGGNVPTIDSRDIKTTVLVNNGDTIVLGGIYETTKSTATSKVPLLGDLPLFGWLFRSTQTIDNKDELLIFVTPKILDSGVNTASTE
jgi:type IV pilus assembly protein PilQ